MLAIMFFGCFSKQIHGQQKLMSMLVFNDQIRTINIRQGRTEGGIKKDLLVSKAAGLTLKEYPVL